jgi:diacylglycerol O-acyltransferase / wax synthase
MASSAPTGAAGPLTAGVRGRTTAWGGAATASAPSVRRSRWWFELLIVAWLAWLYDIVTNLAPLRTHVAIGHAWGIWHAEQALHLDPELTLNHWLAAHHALAVVASYYYDNAHFIVTFGLLGYLWWRRPDIYRPLRNSLALVNVIGFAVFWLYPLAPPRMLTSVGFTDVVANSGTFGSWHTGALASSADQLAAMPSLHIAWACWCALAVWRMTSRPALRVLGVLYPCLTAVVVCATGNHFLFDVLGGAAAMALSVWLVEIAPRLLRGVGRSAALR